MTGLLTLMTGLRNSSDRDDGSRTDRDDGSRTFGLSGTFSKAGTARDDPGAEDFRPPQTSCRRRLPAGLRALSQGQVLQLGAVACVGHAGWVRVFLPRGRWRRHPRKSRRAGRRQSMLTPKKDRHASRRRRAGHQNHCWNRLPHISARSPPRGCGIWKHPLAFLFLVH